MWIISPGINLPTPGPTASTHLEMVMLQLEMVMLHLEMVMFHLEMVTFGYDGKGLFHAVGIDEPCRLFHPLFRPQGA